MQGESVELRSANKDVAAQDNSQIESGTKPRRRTMHAAGCLRRTSSRTKALLGLGLIALLVGVVQIWSVWHSAKAGNTLESGNSALDGYYYYYYRRSAQEGHFPVVSEQKHSRADAASGKKNKAKDGKKHDKWLVAGAHVWLVSEQKGGTLTERVNDNDWRVELDDGDNDLVEVRAKVENTQDDGAPLISNIVPFLSKRQRIMKERLKTLLQVRVTCMRGADDNGLLSAVVLCGANYRASMRCGRLRKMRPPQRKPKRSKKSARKKLASRQDWLIPKNEHVNELP